MYAPYTNLQFLAVFLHFRVRPIPSPYGRCAVGVILEGTPTATEITNHLIINALPKTIAVGVPPIWTPTAAGLADDEGGAKRGGAGTEGGGVKCNVLILSWLHKRGVSKTDTPLLRNRLYFNILHFTLEIGSGARVLGKGGGAWGDEGSAERGNWFFRHRPEK